MEIKAKIPFQQILTVVKALTPSQKVRLKKELVEPKAIFHRHSDFTKLLLSGPVFSEKQLQNIEENRKNIQQWRTKR